VSAESAGEGPRQTTQSVAASLVLGVELLCLDAGNTVIFFDHERVARLCGERGVSAPAKALVQGEATMKLALERGEELDVPWSGGGVPSSRGWGRTMATILAGAGVPREALSSLLDALWPEHTRLNLWSMVPAGLPDALERVRRAGVRVAIVSNSEGMLEDLFRRLGLLPVLDLVVDSGVVGVEKPDPRIFRIALEHFRVAPEGALHLGDTYATDVLGARAAGVRVALVDPLGHSAGRHADVPRVPGTAEVALAIAEARQARG
jgi:putative hydrolase of the HAD superfamily